MYAWKAKQPPQISNVSPSCFFSFPSLLSSPFSSIICILSLASVRWFLMCPWPSLFPTSDSLVFPAPPPGAELPSQIEKYIPRSDLYQQQQHFDLRGSLLWLCNPGFDPIIQWHHQRGGKEHEAEWSSACHSALGSSVTVTVWALFVLLEDK